MLTADVLVDQVSIGALRSDVTFTAAEEPNRAARWSATFTGMDDLLASFSTPDSGGLLLRDTDSEWVWSGHVLDSETGSDGVTRVVGESDTSLLATRIGHPRPDLADTPSAVWFTDAAWVTYTGERSAVANFVNANAGPSAIVARRVLTAIVGTRLGDNPPSTIVLAPTMDLQSVLATLDQFATAKDIIVSVVCDGRGELFAVVDWARTTTVEMSQRLNQAAVAVKSTRALATAVTGFGPVPEPEEGVEPGVIPRMTVRTSGATGLGRRERFLADTSAEDQAALEASGDEMITENAASDGVTVLVTDSDQYRYGVDYALGDRVTIRRFDETRTVERVSRAVTSRVDGHWSRSVTVGAVQSEPGHAQLKAHTQLLERVERLERQKAMEAK